MKSLNEIKSELITEKKSGTELFQRVAKDKATIEKLLKTSKVKNEESIKNELSSIAELWDNAEKAIEDGKDYMVNFYLGVEHNYTKRLTKLKRDLQVPNKDFLGLYFDYLGNFTDKLKDIGFKYYDSKELGELPSDKRTIKMPTRVVMGHQIGGGSDDATDGWIHPKSPNLVFGQTSYGSGMGRDVVWYVFDKDTRDIIYRPTGKRYSDKRENEFVTTITKLATGKKIKPNQK